MKLLFSILIIALLAGWSYGQQAPNGTDIQVRLLVHVQRFPDKGNIGFAGWAVIPDLTRVKPTRALFVGGVVFRDAKKQKWIEFMGGAFVDTKGKVDPVLDIRVTDNSRKKLSLYGEVLHAAKAHRTIISGTATTPLPLSGSKFSKRFGLRAGGEFEAISDRAGSRGAFGPRLGGIVPGTNRKVSWASAYLFGANQQNAWRTYVVLNL